jgi:hypothetical protein
MPTSFRHRLRVNYAHKRLALLTKKGLAALERELQEDDEEDELASDEGEDEVVLEKRDAVFAWAKGKKVVAEPDDKNYDPFGDEPEIC